MRKYRLVAKKGEVHEEPLREHRSGQQLARDPSAEKAVTAPAYREIGGSAVRLAIGAISTRVRAHGRELSLMYQLVKSLDRMHNKGIFHRDIKPENILVEDNRKFKLADFGSYRGIYSKQPYTEYTSTRWYRAPECLLTDGYYGHVGCWLRVSEITSLYPLFPGSNELDQIHRIHKILVTPTPEVLKVFKQKQQRRCLVAVQEDKSVVAQAEKARGCNSEQQQHPQQPVIIRRSRRYNNFILEHSGFYLDSGA
ncbi:Cmgc/rck protein kinase, partial [Globisporangium splendens]